MISCAFVLILRFLDPNKLLEKDSTGHHTRLERLVILGSDGGRSYYDAYDNPSPGKFPVPDTKYNLATTIKEKVRDGTNLKAYCSHTKSSVKIAEILGRIISTETAYYHDLVPADPRYDTCLAYIKKLADIQNAKPIDEHNQSPLSATTLCQNKQCSNSDLINLAHLGQISVSGTYGYLAPPNRKAQLKVSMDKHVKLEDLLKSHHANGVLKNTRSILVLYFGHLHVFEKDSNNSIWFPVTRIGSEDHNVEIILNFIRKYTEILKELDTIVQTSRLKYKLFDFCHRMATCDPTLNQMKRKQMAKIGNIKYQTYTCDTKYI
ncbi:unnamed protein product [Blumeria hordei]|uniref:Uncharacterized protein n=1 Tax=Blumeria hordei TaxID=2867405 RepID=A0A383UPE2_BLUHO|nr:unnamed protein product [Blumeria hordei]